MTTPAATSTTESPFMTTEEVAEHYRTAVSTVRYWRHTGYGPHSVRVGKRVLYTRAAIEAFDAALGSEQAVG